MSKVVLIDMSVLAFKSIFNYELALKCRRGEFILPSDYGYFSSLIACLKKINLSKEDTVILCLDDKSWRKNYYAPYKAQRKEAREKHTLINWDKEFNKISVINEKLQHATPFNVVRVTGCEADDIFSVACRVFKDREVIIASIDSDLHQLCFYPNVKMFNLNFKTSKGKGGYVRVSQEDALNIIEKKVKRGDVADNILVDKDTDEEADVELRRMIINLLVLPEFVEKPITEVLTSLPNKSEIVWDKLPFPESLGKRFGDIYKPEFKLDYDYCLKLQEKRVIKKKEKECLKRKMKKEIKNGLPRK